MAARSCDPDHGGASPPRFSTRTASAGRLPSSSAARRWLSEPGST
jgi:hypothetical protein